MISSTAQLAFRIRRTRTTEADKLPEIEKSAAQAFESIPALSWIADEPPMSAEVHRRSIQAGTCWVAVDTGKEDAPVGFLTASVENDDIHIAEMSVASDWQGQGIGSALIQTLKQWSFQNKLSRITLTTFLDIPWNAPFYLREGFVIVPEDALDTRLAALLEAELRHGFSKNSRCVMRFELNR